MISSDHSCKRLVAGNYDVLINEPFIPVHQSILTNYLEHFERYESELGQLRAEQIDQLTATDCSYINEFKLLKELSKSLKEDKDNLVEGETKQNQRKNRYKDILPFSHTRVILSSNPDVATQSRGQQSDKKSDDITADNTQDASYINANYVSGPSGSPRAYIACQGPLSNTLNDFWRMIWECNVSVIVMACNEYESGKPKCELYWPDQIDGTLIYGNYQVTLLRIRQINDDFLIRKFSVKLLAPLRKDSQINNNSIQHQVRDGNNNNSGRNINLTDNTMRSDNQYEISDKFTVDEGTNNVDNTTSLEQVNGTDTYECAFSNGNRSASNDSIGTSNDSTSNNSKLSDKFQTTFNQYKREVLMERTICQFHYTTWPDHGVPPSVYPILELVRLIREVQPAEDKPILVHCSAGCGRTGTICCIDYVWGLLRMGNLNENFNLCNIISEMRRQRMSMVQTLAQYILCHRAVAALFVQQLQLISLDNNHNHQLEQSKLLDHRHTSMEDNRRDEIDLVINDNDLDDQEQDLGPVFI